MIKTLLKNTLSIVAIVVMWGIYSIGYLSLPDALNALTLVVFVSVLAMATEDVFAKLLLNRELITWQYAILIAFVLTCDFLWLYLADCATWIQLAIRAILLVIAAFGTFIWAFFAYRISVMSEQERTILYKSIAYKKIAKKFKGMSDEQVRTALESTLFCYLEGDSLEGGLLVSEPFTPEFKTYSELSSSTDNDIASALSIANGYIDLLIKNRKENK